MAFPYTPEFLAHLRHRYEETDEPVMSIAADFEMDEKNVYRIARRSKWRMRSERRTLPRHIQLLDAARAAAGVESATMKPSWPGRPEGPSPGHPRLEPSEVQDVDARDKPGHDDKPTPSLTLPLSGGGNSALDRLEQLILKEIESEEVRRAAAGTAPLAPAETVHKARAYSTMLQTLQTIERARNEQDAPPANSLDPSDDIPRNIDEFRNALARRIDAFVAGRADVRHAEGSGEPEVVDEAR